MQSYTKNIGERVREIRERMGLSVADFAARVACQPRMVEIIEANGILHEQYILRVLERIAVLAGCPVDELLFHDTSLVSSRIAQLQVQAIRMIDENRWANSVAVVTNVMQQIEDECELAIGESGAPDGLFRNQGGILNGLDEDRVHEMVVRARQTLQ